MEFKGYRPQPTVVVRSHVLGFPDLGVRGPMPSTKPAVKSHVQDVPIRESQGYRPEPSVLLRGHVSKLPYFGVRGLTPSRHVLLRERCKTSLLWSPRATVPNQDVLPKSNV